MEADLELRRAAVCRTPFYIPELREKTGLDQPGADYVVFFPPDPHDTLWKKLRDQLTFSSRCNAEEGKNGAGHRGGAAPGGRHRSVALTHALGGGHSEPWIPLESGKNHRDKNR